MPVPTIHEAIPPVPVTALVVDIRNFTPHLIGTGDDEQGINKFCHFLASFYALCLRSALMALPSAMREDPPLYMSSTGDGVLTIFTGEKHYLHAYLAAILLNRVLGHYCADYNLRRDRVDLPQTSFGIGVESGSACRIRAVPQNTGSSPVVDTFIGNCINIASRVEAVTKGLYRANTLISASTNEFLCQEFFHESYRALEVAASGAGVSDADRHSVFEKMEAWHRELCMTYIHHHMLKGVDTPLPLFRLSDTSSQLGNPRFDRLLKRLAGESPEYEEDVRRFLRQAELSQEATPLELA